MPLTTKQKELIIYMDGQAKKILEHGGDEELLMSLAGNMPQIKDLMDSAVKGELDFYCQQYDGFYRYMKLLERMASACSQGAFADVLNNL